MIKLVVGGTIYLVSVGSATLAGSVTGAIRAGVSQHRKTVQALQRASQRAEETRRG